MVGGTTKPRLVTRQHKISAFRAATNSFADAGARWTARARTGLSDDDLTAALRYELGECGGASAQSDCPSIMYQKSGLKIWASWEGFNHRTTKPIYAGKATLKIARDVYGIKQPNDKQLDLFCILTFS